MERINIDELQFIRYENPNTDLVGSRVSIQIESGAPAIAKKRYGTVIGEYEVEEGQVCVLWDDEEGDYVSI